MLHPVFSIVVPCYNEQEVLDETHKRLSSVMQKMGEPYEIVYINDGSRDQTPLMLNRLAEQDPAVRVVHFARNRGHQIAVSAGLDYAAGDAVVIIDADLQDPPEIIPEMTEKWREGYEVVYGQRRSRKGESKLKELTAGLYYTFLRKLAGDIFPRDTGDFRLVDRKAVDVVRKMPEHARYLRGMFSWVGFKQTPVLFDRDKRFAGETHYPLRKMLRLAGDGIVSFSDKPLSLGLFLGLLFGGFGCLGALILFILMIAGVPGGLWWLAVLLLIMGGSILFTLGIMGRYLARIFDDVKGRPLYVVADTRGIPAE